MSRREAAAAGATKSGELRKLVGAISWKKIATTARSGELSKAVAGAELSMAIMHPQEMDGGAIRSPEDRQDWACGNCEARDVFKAKEVVLQKKISQEMEWAKEFTKSGNKQAAMQCLKRKKYYGSQMNQVQSIQLRIPRRE